MQLNSEILNSDVLNRVSYLVGSAEILSHMSDVPVLPPFSEKVVDFLNDLSKALMKFREYSEVITFAFWIRRASLSNLKERFLINKDEEFRINLRIGRGLVFHIAPSNVPVNFAYSLVSALLCGNANIVRVSSKFFPQVEIITNTINTVLASHQELKAYIACVRYEHDKEINDLFSSLCDARIIWGGNRTIEALRQSPLPPRSTEITFADRYSLAVIDADTYLAIENKEKVAQDFYNDTYFSDQNACTSPRIVIWTGSTIESINEAKEQFWQLEYELVKQKYNFQPIMAVDKLARSYIDATKQETIKVEQNQNNLIVRVSIHDLPHELSNVLSNDIEFDNNSGYFYESDVIFNKLTEKLLELCDNKRCQTIAYIGNEEMFADLLESLNRGVNRRIKGIDRIVPVGKTMDFDLIWDGYNLPVFLTREISFSAVNPKHINSIKHIATSLIDFLNILQKQKSENLVECLVVYRGHSNEAYEIKPSLFRKGNEKFRDCENEILKEVEAARPDAFSPNMTTLEKLVLLQHYQMPTRLLDVTLNPLVALYFTVCSSKDKDGEVLVFNVDNSIIKSFDSDTVACFANLSQLNKADKDHINELLQTRKQRLLAIKDVLAGMNDKTVRKNIEENYNQLLNIYMGDPYVTWDLALDFICSLVKKALPENPLELGYETPEDDIEGLLQIKDLSKLIEESKIEYFDYILQDNRIDFNKDPVLYHLVHFIRSEKPFFENSINPLDLHKILYVKAKQSNPRIVAQNGAFFIFGMKNGITEKRPMQPMKITKIKIAAGSKDKIKNELNRIGINEHALFPEFEYFIKDVKEKYRR